MTKLTWQRTLNSHSQIPDIRPIPPMPRTPTYPAGFAFWVPGARWTRAYPLCPRGDHLESPLAPPSRQGPSTRPQPPRATPLATGASSLQHQNRHPALQEILVPAKWTPVLVISDCVPALGHCTFRPTWAQAFSEMVTEGQPILTDTPSQHPLTSTVWWEQQNIYQQIISAFPP